MSPPVPPATKPLYIQDDHCFECDAILLAVDGNSLAFDQTCFHPGGGGQPPDQGQANFYKDQLVLPISTVQADNAGVLWHTCPDTLPDLKSGQSAHLMLNIPRRLALMRYHTVLHILNTIALRNHQAWITGVQIGTESSRIDFNFNEFNQELCRQLEDEVNQIIRADHTLCAYTISREQFDQRPDLLRTLDVKPPIHHGKVRVVEISGFDAQACGGTHVDHTGELGHFSILRIENKGRNNKRLYVHLGVNSFSLGREDGDR